MHHSSPHPGTCTHLVSVPGSALCIIKYIKILFLTNKEQRNVCALVIQ